MKLSVVIPVKADARLEHCLAALSRQTLERDRYEVVVVDDGPDAATVRLAERFSARYLARPGGGAYAARAAGAQAAEGDVLVFTDADCIPPPGWLSTLAALFEDSDCKVVIGPSTAAGDSPVSRWAQDIDDERWRALQRSERVAFTDTRNLAVRREVLQAVPFDPSLRHAGDVDLGVRLYRAGIEIRVEPAAWVAHDNPHSLLAIIRRGMRRGRGVARLERKYGPLDPRSGGRPLTLAGRDVKPLVLRLAASGVTRPVIIVFVAVSAAGLLPVLWIAARLPGAAPLGHRAFVVFERLTLLIGRLTR